MASTTFLALLDQLLVEPGLNAPAIENRLGYKFSALTIGNTSLTTSDPNLLILGTSVSLDRLQGYHLYMGTAGESRIATTMTISSSTATINFLGGNATNQAAPTTVYLLRVPFTELMALANDALEYIPVECVVPLRHGSDDADMSANNTTSWTGTNATVAKQVTAPDVLWGPRSLSITLTAGGGYATGTTVRAGQTASVVGYAIAKADIGTGIYRLMDQSSNTLDSVSFTQEQWLLVRKIATLAADDEGVIPRILGTDNLDQIDVQASWVVRRGENLFQLPTWLDERFKLKSVALAEYRQSGQEADTWLAQSVNYVRLQQDVHYRYFNHQADVNGYWLEMIDTCFNDWPVFLFIECPYAAPYGVDASFTTGASTTTCPPHLLTAYWKKLIGGSYSAMFTEAEKRGEREYSERFKARQTSKPALPGWHGPTGGRKL